jgi:hypothetical protein
MCAVLVVLSLAMSPVALAQQQDHETPACAAMDVTLPAGLEDWNGRAAIWTGAASTDSSDLQLGKGYEATFAKRDSVAFAVAPEKPGGSVSYSGVFAFTVPEAGNYAVALSSAAWIDVVEDGKALEPLSFGHGPACTTIRKIVVYPLKAGRHIVQVAGSGAEAARLLVAKQP